MSSRATQLSVDQVRNLDHFATMLDVVFPKNIGLLHVGSSLTRADYRDVDVRVVHFDEDHEQLAGVITVLDLNMMLSEWGQRVTGLPIDCQVQSTSESNTESDQRNSLSGMARNRQALDAKDFFETAHRARKIWEIHHHEQGMTKNDPDSGPQEAEDGGNVSGGPRD